MASLALLVAGAGCQPWPPAVNYPPSAWPATDSGEAGEGPVGSAGPPPAPVAPGPSSEGVGQGVGGTATIPAPSDALLACIRRYEGAYTTDTGNGYFGAYQFLPSTWRGAVTGAGFAEWANRPASEAPPEVQDAAALWLIGELGLQPWPTPAVHCSRQVDELGVMGLAD